MCFRLPMSEQKRNNINYTLMFDGGSRGNPGICGCGFVIYMNDELISQDSCVISENNTNNYAEYMALILGLTKAKELNIKKLSVKGESKLVINQVTNKFNVKSENLKDLYAEAKMLILHLPHYCSISHESPPGTILWGSLWKICNNVIM